MRFIDEMDIKGKKVLFRVDYNVPLDKDANITDDSRIRATLRPSIMPSMKMQSLLLRHIWGDRRGNTLTGLAFHLWQRDFPDYWAKRSGYRLTVSVLKRAIWSIK